ncbi:MAG TPA: hypothetical protein VMZ04_01380 [Anaerolineae bacterium]|nr:hypothetical protein [Anaerolineae bacterium]
MANEYLENLNTLTKELDQPQMSDRRAIRQLIKIQKAQNEILENLVGRMDMKDGHIPGAR